MVVDKLVQLQPMRVELNLLYKMLSKVVDKLLMAARRYNQKKEMRFKASKKETLILIDALPQLRDGANLYGRDGSVWTTVCCFKTSQSSPPFPK